jgi:GNAT superfamily N-acetyltransferase
MACVVTTRHNAALRLRPIRPEDAPGLVAFHESLSASSIYRRFFTVHPHLTSTEIQRFTCVDYLDRLALIMEDEAGIVAVGRYERSEGTTEAEVAFVVADTFQHLGLGTLLLEHLADAAWRIGIQTFFASVLADNHDMVGVFVHSGFDVGTRFEDGTVEVRFSIEPDASYLTTRAAHHDRTKT